MPVSKMNLTFKKGQKVHYDEVIEFVGLLPCHAYEQSDPLEWNIETREGSSEILTFLHDVDISIRIHVK